MSSDKPKWKAKADITYEELFNPNWNIPHIGIVRIGRELESQLGKKKAHEIIVNAANARPDFKTTKTTPEEIVKEWREALETSSPVMKHALEMEFEDVSPTKFKLRVEDCLFARAFRGMEAADIGYLWECNSDYESTSRFHPNLKMKRTRTLMQGDDFCDFTWYWEESK